jgi:uncharacterized membrane protein YoaK (UPF0700 family)
MPAASPARTRDLLLVALALTTGATDATVFERLGSVFASVITGNLVLLGVSAARPDGRLALFAACALAGYSIGAFAAAPGRRPAGEHRPVWPRATTLALIADLGVLCAFAVGWELSGGHPGRGAQAVLLTIASMAMGIQSAAVRRLGQMSTTYLTSTLTGLLESARNRRWSDDERRSLAIVAVAVIGAACATVVVDDAAGWLPALQLAPLVVVIGVAGRACRAA